MNQTDHDKWIVLSAGFTFSFFNGAAAVFAIWAVVDWSLLLACCGGVSFCVSRIGRCYAQQFEFRRIEDQ